MVQDLTKATDEPLELPIGPITRAQVKKFKKAIRASLIKFGEKLLQDSLIELGHALYICHATCFKLNFK
ncbi:hypothetical protein J1N35_022657, partial [Gossypium stocksii]